MNDADAVLERYARAQEAYGRDCQTDTAIWHRPDTAEFTALRDLLVPYAAAGHRDHQYALATIYLLGLCFETEDEYHAGYANALAQATPWWIAAAMQGHEAALDNLVTCGVGPEAERAKNVWRQLEKERQELVLNSRGMPLYGPDFLDELMRRYLEEPGKKAP